MNARLARSIELNVDRVASATLAGAVGFAVFALIAEGHWWGFAAAVAGAGVAYQLSRRALVRLAERDQHFRLPPFHVTDAGSADELLLTQADRLGDELLLTEADRLVQELVLTDSDRFAGELLLTDADRWPESAPEPLLLEDVVEAIGPDSRVIRLFDPGDLRARIDRQVDRRSSLAGFNDASQELANALADLRKALR